MILDSWIGGSRDSAPETLGYPFPKSRNQGTEKLGRSSRERGRQPPPALSLPGSNFAILTTPFPLPGSGPATNGNTEQDVGEDFPGVGGSARSPGRYKATLPARGTQMEKREAVMSSWSPERNQR